MIDSFVWNIERQQKQTAWLAWHIAALSRAKRLPPLQRLIKAKPAKEIKGDELKRRRAERDDMLRRIDVDKINRAKLAEARKRGN